MTLPNVDQTEVAKFDEMAKQWWDLNGPCKPLHDLNPLRLDFIRARCAFSNLTFLDIGCGGGILTESLCQNKNQVIGIDQSTQALEVATEHAKSLENPPTYIHTTAEAYADEHPGEFDAIACMELLEHVPEPADIIKACTRLLKPGGHLFLSTLNRTPQAFVKAIIGAEYLLKMLPKGTHHYRQFLKPSEVANLARGEGFCLKTLQGIDYQFWQKSFQLSDNISVNYLMHLVKEG